MVEGLEEPLRRAVPLEEGGAGRDVAGQVRTGVADSVDLALDEGVAGVAVGADGGDADGAVLVADRLRLLEDPGSGGAGLLDALVDVRDLEGDVDDTVPVLGMVLDERAVRGDGTLDDEASPT